MDNEYNIKDIISLFLSKIWLIIIVGVIGGAAAFLYTRYVMPLQYSSHISMYIQSYTTFSEDPDQQYNNISYSKQLINTYIEVLKDDAVIGAVGKQLEKNCDPDKLVKCFGAAEDISAGAIRNTLSITSVTDTSALKVVSTTLDPDIAAAVCNSLAKVSPGYLSDAVGVGQINTIDTAKVYSSPVGPNIKKNTLIGVAAGLMLIMLIILVIDFFDNTVKETEGLRKKYKKSIIGEIQDHSGKKRRSVTEDDHVKLTDDSVPFNVVESYKSIRTNVNFALATSERKIFAVSSANPGEGKSTVSANAAIAIAQSGSKVLLIDGDMRKSVQHRIFGLKNKKGLSTAISRMDDIGSCISRNVMEDLDVLTAGPIPPNPSELLGSESMVQLIEKLSQEYSYIVIDTPPVNVVTDAMELADKAAGIIMVLRYASTTTDDVDSAMKKIEQSNMNMLGFVLNDVKVKKNGKYYKYKGKYGYGYGYGYQPQIEETDEKPEEKPKDDPKDKSEEKPKEKSGKKGGK
ncbi:MAG: polysaccharide biosynthesis tyrosine autokinase [Ruminococcus sp.]|nr:polysaccharide biosynthesis tyrosine autokinase [Ruminococcus sp.]